MPTGMRSGRVVSEPTAAEQLADLLGWHVSASMLMMWDAVEAGLGVLLPNDFKRPMSVFPSGAFAERFYVYSPIQSERSFEEFRSCWREGLDVLTELRDAGLARLPYPPYPEPGGLIPWGVGDEHTYYWHTVAADPDTWTVVFAERFAMNWGVYTGGVSSFLFDVITGRFSHPHLYYEPDEEGRKFSPYDGI